MTCRAELHRRYATREEACAYLASRGFLFLPGGWANGRWVATLDSTSSAVIVSIWLQAARAA